MKKLHLGKILTLLILPLLLVAGSVRATLDKPLVYKGDRAVLSIEAEGSDVKFPSIDSIAGFRVLGSSKSQNFTSINGVTKQTFTKSYTFAPTKSVKIPSFKVMVDSKELKTNPLNLKISTPKAANKNAPVQLEMNLAKENVYVGEPVRLDIVFKKDPDSEFAKVEIAEPNLESFWAKKLPDTPQYSKDGYIIQKYSYLLFPQQEGNFTIPAIFAKLGIAQRRSRGGMFNDPFFNDPFFSSFGGASLQWKKLFSNDVKLHVKALPDNLSIYGDFKIKAIVDKKTIQANKALNLTIAIEGEGNLEDIEKFSLDIPEAVVYADEPIIKGSAYDGNYQGVFSQKIAIVADRNYTIPSISLSYFDKKTNAKKTISTQPIDIVVKGGSNTPKIETSTPKLQTALSNANENKKEVSDDKTVVSKESNPYEKYIYLLIGTLFGAIITYLLLGYKPKKRVSKKPDIIKQIQKAKDDKTLFELLLPYANKDKDIKEQLDKLEKNIYKGGKEKIDKDLILDYFEEVV